MKIKHIFLISLLFLACFGFASKTFAGTEHNIFGWAWAENIGWISLNSTTTNSPFDYGITIEPTYGGLTGYAWSENIGWISFDKADTSNCLNCGVPSPISIYYNAYYNFTDNKIYGCARALAGEISPTPSSSAGGWSGCINLQPPGNGGMTPEFYVGTHINEEVNPKELKGWATEIGGGTLQEDSNRSVIGWISFNCRDSAMNCYYKPTVIIKHPPYVTFEGNPVSTVNCPEYKVWFSWIYHDLDTEAQMSYWIQADDSMDFGSPDLDFQASQTVEDGHQGNSTPISVIEGSYPGSGPKDKLYFNKTYYWRIKVQDSSGTWSQEWLDGPTLTTPLHQSPFVNFMWDPYQPAEGNPINFISSVSFYDDACDVNPKPGFCRYVWTFAGGVPEVSYEENPQGVIFETPGSKSVTLEVIDKDERTCSLTKTVNTVAGMVVPQWQETLPFGE